MMYEERPVSGRRKPRTPRTLHRAAPHVDGLDEPRGDDRHGVNSQVAAEGGMVQPGALEKRGRPKRPGGNDHLARPDDEAPRRTRARPRIGEGRLDADRSAAIEEHAAHRRPGHDPRAGQSGLGEVGTDAGLLRPAPAPEWAAAAVLARRRVAPDRLRVPAERRRTTQDRRVLRRDGRRGRNPELPLEVHHVPLRKWGVPAVDAVVARPLRAHVGRRVDAGPVHERPAADRAAGEDRHGAVPGRDEPVVEIEPIECGELVARHRRLVDERTGLEHDDGPAGTGEVVGDNPATRPGADHHDLRVQFDRSVRIGRQCRPVRPDRARRGPDRWVVRAIADRREERVRDPLAGIRVGQEGEQLAQAMERRPAERQAGVRPAQQVALAGRRREVAERSRPAGQHEVRDRRLDEPKDEPEPADLGGVGRRGQRLRGQLRSSDGAAPDERLGQLGERRELGGGPVRRGGGHAGRQYDRPRCGAGRIAVAPGCRRVRGSGDTPAGAPPGGVSLYSADGPRHHVTDRSRRACGQPVAGSRPLFRAKLEPWRGPPPV
jgi:hypothetical protein